MNYQTKLNSRKYVNRKEHTIYDVSFLNCCGTWKTQKYIVAMGKVIVYKSCGKLSLSLCNAQHVHLGHCRVVVSKNWLAYKSKLYILSIVFIKWILLKIVTKKWKKLINSKLLKPSQISKSTTGLFSIYFSHECAHRTTHGSLRVCSQTSWTLHLEIFRMDPCSNNYFN